MNKVYTLIRMHSSVHIQTLTSICFRILFLLDQLPQYFDAISHIFCFYRIGTGIITACGGDGFGGGGGGRVSVDVFSRHEDPKIKAHGRRCYACACVHTHIYYNYTAAHTYYIYTAVS